MVNRNQITYFFGAGASYHAIPTIDGLPGRINNLIEYLTEKKETLEGGNATSFLSELIIKHKQTLIDIIHELTWLINESEQHQTVDTLAKKFYVQEDNQSLCRLKRALIIYFFFEQNILIPTYSVEINKHKLLLDKRYDNLIASIAERKNTGVELKGHIKFITWNYDLQIDLALRNYFSGNLKNINTIKNEIQIHPNQYSYNLQNLQNGQLIDINKFAAIKLNGNAFLDNGFDNGSNGGFTINDLRFKNNDPEKLDILGKFLSDYYSIFNKGVNSNHAVYKYFNFAWEKDEKYLGHQNVILEAIRIMNATKVLIIVGYSFPYFNSEIDKQLFAKCNPNIILIQDPDSEEIKDRILQYLPQTPTPFNKDKIKSVPIGKYFPIHFET